MKKSIVLSSVALAGAALVAGALPSYQKAPQMKISRDASASSADMISYFSCILASTGAHNAVTASNPHPDPYLALIDFNACWPGGSASTETGSTPSYEKYWVDASFASEKLTIKAWEYSHSDRIKYLTAEIRQGINEAPPYGNWTVDACVGRLVDETSSDDCAKKVHISMNGNQAYDLYYRREQSGTWTAYDQLAHGEIAADSGSGSGKYFNRYNDLDANSFEGTFAFKGQALLDKANGTSTCKIPIANASGARKAVWEAWLYDPNTYEPLIANAGFPVRKVGTAHMGWAGSEGIRLNGSSGAEQSGTFVRIDEEGGQYTAFGTFGKLVKITNSQLENGIKGIDGLILKTRLYKDAFSDSLFPTPQKSASRQYVLFYWDDDLGKFVFFAYDKSSTGDKGKDFANFDEPYKFTVAELLTHMRASTIDNNGEPRHWERKLWGFQTGSNNNYVIQLADENPPDYTYPERARADILVTRQIQTQVVPGTNDAPSEGLVCIGRCPRPATDNNKLVLENAYEYARSDTRASQLYNFDNQTGALSIGGKNVEYDSQDAYIDRTTNGVDATRDYLWLDNFVTTSQLADLKCKKWRDGAQQDFYCAYDTVAWEDANNNPDGTSGVEALDYYYAWTTGDNRWERFNGIRDSSGKAIVIPDPMNLIYDTPDQAAYGKFAGKKAAIRYLGNGQLWLPGHCENIADANAAVTNNCSDKTNEVWVHDFVIPTTTEAAGRIHDLDGNEYLVKWHRQGVLFPRASDSVCAAANLATSVSQAETYQLPEISSWINPKEIIGELPDIADDVTPRFINGNEP